MLLCTLGKGIRLTTTSETVKSLVMEHFTHEDALMAQVGNLSSKALSVFGDLAALSSTKGREVS